MSEIDEKTHSEVEEKEPGYDEWAKKKIGAGLKESKEHSEESVSEEELRKELGLEN